MATITSGASSTIASSGSGRKPVTSSATFFAPASLRMASALVFCPPTMHAAVLHGQHEQGAQRPADLGAAQSASALKSSITLLHELLALGLGADDLGDRRTLPTMPPAELFVGHLDVGHAGRLQRLDDLGRARAAPRPGPAWLRPRSRLRSTARACSRRSSSPSGPRAGTGWWCRRRRRGRPRPARRGSPSRRRRSTGCARRR